MKLNLELDIPAERIADLMVGALERNDFTRAWCWGVHLSGALKGKARELRTEDGCVWYANPRVYELPDFELTVFEIEDEGKEVELDDDDNPVSNVKRHKVTQAEIARGFSLMARQYPSHMSDFLRENEDAVTSDLFLQLTALGEAIYG